MCVYVCVYVCVHACMCARVCTKLGNTKKRMGPGHFGRPCDCCTFVFACVENPFSECQNDFYTVTQTSLSLQCLQIHLRVIVLIY